MALTLLVACGGNPVETPAPLVGQSAATLQPTPTLADAIVSTGVSTAQPPTPLITPQGTAATPTPTTATPTHTTIPSATPTHTPEPAVRLTLAQNYLLEQNYEAAIEQLQASLSPQAGLEPEHRKQALHDLAVVYLREGRPVEAADALNALLALTNNPAEGTPTTPQPLAPGPQPLTPTYPLPITTTAYFYLGQAYQAQGEHEAAVAAYQSYLEAAPEMAAYVQPRIATCYLSLDDQPAAVAAYEAALRGPAHRLTIYELRLRLAELYVEAGQYPQAIAQYDAIHEQAVTENTRGQVTYLAGYTELLGGDTKAGYERYLKAINDYPHAYESYLSLVALVEAGYTVDDYQRGLVDYYAGAYEPAVAALERYLVSHPTDAHPDAHLYRAWSYGALGNLEASLAALDAYLATAPEDPTTAGRAWLERADLYAQYDRTSEAIDTYHHFVETYPTHPQAATAAWEAAVLTEEVDAEAAAAEYVALVDRYPGSDKAPAALFRAGLLFHLKGDDGQAQAAWRRLVEAYATTEEGAAGLIWLMKTLPPDQARPYRDLAAAGRPSENYYYLRAYHLATDTNPLESPLSSFILHPSSFEQAEAEAWLREKLGLDAPADVSSLSPALAQDQRLRVGTRLWQLGLWAEARRELEGLREAYAQDTLATYQLALAFRDLGLYRSSIVAAATVLRQLEANAFTAPPFLGRLVYPVYYADLILPLADQYGYDPFLQFALVRQESLFESFATSSAAAQGLSQVIPDTGAYIALKLGWPDYTNEDLYKPYVGLAFGAYYLDEQLRAFAGNVYVALSAYNGGPGNAARWYQAAGDDLDLYLETVSFAETRSYVERIYVGYAVYRYLYDEDL